jgi:hypothetical protein
MEKKIAALKYPKSCSYRPVLIHVNGVSEEVAESGFFSSIIDASQFLDHDFLNDPSLAQGSFHSDSSKVTF